MNRIYLSAIIVIIGVFCRLSAESVKPVHNPPGENNDPRYQYPNADMAIWQNMTAAYKNMRDVATESKLSMTKVRGFAASGNKLLMSINSISRTVGKLWEKTDAYNKIFGFNNNMYQKYNNYHYTIDGVDVNIKNDLKALGVDLDKAVFPYGVYIDSIRGNIIRNIDDVSGVNGELERALAMPQTVVDTFTAKYKRLAQESATDARVYKFASIPLDSGGSGAARRYVVAQNAALNAVAGVEMRNAEIDAEALRSVIMMVDPAVGSEVMKGAIDTKTLVRNRLIADLRGIETQQAAVGVMGQILMSKLIGVDGKLYQNANQASVFYEYKVRLSDGP